MNIFKEIHVIYIGIFIFLLAFTISYRMIPLIIATVKYKKLMDVPDNRSSHTRVTPTMGGIAFFGGLMICLFFIQLYDLSMFNMNLVASLTILFFLGLKDDLMVLSSGSKIVFQSIAIFFVIFEPQLIFDDFMGFLSLGEVYFAFSVVLSFGLMIYVINAYNLMDGIDGLSSMLGIVIFSIFGFFFFIVNLFYYFLLSISLVGVLAGFIPFNLSKKRKIFMGDTGSLIIGFMIGIMTLRFLNLSEYQLERIHVSPENLILLTISILFFPVIDVIRVIIIRLMNNKGPFSPDRRHLHHVFIDKGLSHLQASFTLTISSIMSFLIIYGLNLVFSFKWLMLQFTILVLITFYLLLLLDTDPKAITQRKKFKTYIPYKIYVVEFRIRKAAIVLLKKVFFRNHK